MNSIYLNLTINFDCLQQELAEAGDEAQRKYEEETDKNSRATIGLTSAITADIEAKQQKLTTAFTKYLSIVNPANGTQFLSEVQFYNPFKLIQIAVYLGI